MGRTVSRRLLHVFVLSQGVKDTFVSYASHVIPRIYLAPAITKHIYSRISVRNKRHLRLPKPVGGGALHQIGGVTLDRPISTKCATEAQRSNPADSLDYRSGTGVPHNPALAKHVASFEI